MNREDRCQQPTKELLVIPPLPPTDLMYLAAIAEQCECEAKIKDYSLGGDLIADLKEFKPDYLAIEEVFLSKNVMSALKLGQARGAAICAAVKNNVPVYEYSARQIKQAVVGYGNAQKAQVQAMVTSTLHLSGTPQADAADALAGAICHAYTISSLIGMSIGGVSNTKGSSRGRIK